MVAVAARPARRAGLLAPHLEPNSHPEARAHGIDSERGERRALRPDGARLTRLLLGAGIACGLARAVAMAWLCDDAFLCFRYARNLVAGNGPVFNPGERVEGVTDPLWTLWIAAGMALGVSPETWSLGWGLACHAVTLVLLARAHVAARATLDLRSVTLPTGVLALALHTDACAFATSGLETSAFTCLILGGLLTLPAEPAPALKRCALSGLLLGAAASTRHDGLLFAPLATAFLLRNGRAGVRPACAFVGALLAAWLPLAIARHAYYGDLLPNTYYAKSGGTPWYDQGLHYLGLYLRRYAPLALAPVAVLAALLRVRAPAWPAPLRDRAALALAFSVAYAAYVVRVGGDFMFARMLLPATVPLLLAADLSLLALARRWPVGAGLVLPAVALALMAALPSPVSGLSWVHGIGDERAYYSPERAAQTDARAAVVAPLLRGLPVRVAFWGGEARFVYRAEAPVAVEAEAGLTDRFIAHLPLARRGRPGHEKVAPPWYLVERRRVDLAFPMVPRPTPELDAYIPVVLLRVRGVEGRLLHWDPAVVDALRRRGAEVQDFPAGLDRYIAALAQIPRARVRLDLARFQHFYFAFNADPVREAAIRARLSDGGAP